MSVRFDAATDAYSSTASAPTSACTVLCWVKLASDRNGFAEVWISINGTNTQVIELSTDSDGTTPGSWQAELLEGSTSLGTAELDFVDGHPTEGTSKLTFTYATGIDQWQVSPTWR